MEILRLASPLSMRELTAIAPYALAALLAACAQAPQGRANGRRPIGTARPPAPAADAA